MCERSIASTTEELSVFCNIKSGSSFAVAPRVWFQIDQQTCLHVTVGKQYSGLFLPWSRHSRETAAVVTPGGSCAGGDWLTFNLESKEHLFLIHTTQTLCCLGNMNLHSQREAFSSLPSSNLDNCLMFPQGTPGWANLGFETSMDEGDLFLLWCFKRPWTFKRLD